MQILAEASKSLVAVYLPELLAYLTICLLRLIWRGVGPNSGMYPHYDCSIREGKKYVKHFEKCQVYKPQGQVSKTSRTNMPSGSVARKDK